MSSTQASHNGNTESVGEDATARDGVDRTVPRESDDIWPEIVARWNELCEYAGYYIAANVDRLRLTYRTLVMWVTLGVVAGLAAVSMIAAAGVLLVTSLSTGVGQMLGGRVWLGQLVVSSVILIAAGGGVWLVLRLRLRKFHRTLISKYEGRKQQERTEYGTDVEQRAEARSQSSKQAVE